MPEASKIVKAASAILLDFDGPVTRLMPPSVAASAADAARRGLFNAAVPVPKSLEKTKDHLEVLRHAGTLDRVAIRMTDDACIKAEVAAAAKAEPTPSVREMLKAAFSLWAQPTIAARSLLVGPARALLVFGVPVGGAAAIPRFLDLDDWSTVLLGTGLAACAGLASWWGFRCVREDLTALVATVRLTTRVPPPGPRAGDRGGPVGSGGRRWTGPQP